MYSVLYCFILLSNLQHCSVISLLCKKGLFWWLHHCGWIMSDFSPHRGPLSQPRWWNQTSTEDGPAKLLSLNASRNSSCFKHRKCLNYKPSFFPGYFRVISLRTPSCLMYTDCNCGLALKARFLSRPVQGCKPPYLMCLGFIAPTLTEWNLAELGSTTLDFSEPIRRSSRKCFFRTSESDAIIFISFLSCWWYRWNESIKKILPHPKKKDCTY